MAPKKAAKAKPKVKPTKPKVPPSLFHSCHAHMFSDPHVPQCQAASSKAKVAAKKKKDNQETEGPMEQEEPEEVEQEEGEEELDMDDIPKRKPTPVEYRRFKQEILQADPKYLKMVQDIANLPSRTGKQEKLQKLVLAHAMGGFDHKEFKAHESLTQEKSVGKDTTAIPKALPLPPWTFVLCWLALH